MKVISHNEDKTIGIVSDPDNLLPIGYFSPMLLKEWAEKAEKTFGKGEHCALYFRKSDNGDCKYSLLMTNGNESFVMVSGCKEVPPILDP